MPFSCAIAGTPPLRPEQPTMRRVTHRAAIDPARPGVAGLATPIVRRDLRLVSAGRFVTAVPLSAAVAVSAAPSRPVAGSVVTVPMIAAATAR
jgi:hypothetical protein